MKESKPLPEKQSRFDGLCGIFCLVNAIRNWNDCFDENDPDILRYLLESSDRLGLFSVHHVMNGFEVHELIDIFNEFSRAHRFPGQAIHLSAMADSFAKWSFSDQSKRVFAQGGQIVLPVDASKHWVLAHSYDSDRARIMVDDPDPDSDRLEISSREVCGNGRHGVLLLPSDSTLRF